MGVKVYTVVPGVDVVTAGLHAPVIGVALVELVGNTGAATFWQTGANGANVGSVFGGATSVTSAVSVWYGITQP